MKYFQEVTVWSDNPNAINHIYYMNDEKTQAVGYLKFGKGRLFKFKQPLRLDTRGRKFVVVQGKKTEPDEKYFAKVEVPKDRITVQGSNGKEYYLEKVGNRYTCTCPGFTFRQKCKHVDTMA
jgi:hypothetical protein